MGKKFLILAAVYEEVKILVKNLDKDESVIKDNMIIEKGFIEDQKTDILVTGPGILNSVHSTTVYLENHEKPDIIIQMGCAGGFSKAGVQLGDIGIASKETYIHLGVENPDNRIIPSPLPFSLTKNNTIANIFMTNKKYRDNALEIIKKNTDLKAEIYPFVTVSEVTASTEKADILFESYGAGMENMEGAGSAYISFLYEIPFIEIRSASNSTGIRDKFQWDFPLSFSNAGLAVMEVVKNL